jgi:hypothetical protein
MVSTSSISEPNTVPCPQPVVTTRRGALLDAIDPRTGGHGHRLGFPVHLDRSNLLDRLHQSLITQITQDEMLRRAAQRHQRDQFAFVQIDRQRALAWQPGRTFPALLVEDSHLFDQGYAGMGQFGAQGHVGGGLALPKVGPATAEAIWRDQEAAITPQAMRPPELPVGWVR